MYLITPELIRTKNPCYDPSKYLAETYSANLAEFLTLTKIPAVDRIWVATQFLNDKDNRLFAVDCALRALNCVPNPDPRSLAAVEVAKRFAYGEATPEELAARAAWAARGAAEAATWAAAWDAAEAATWAAAWDAARDAAWVAAWVAARAAEREEQVKYLIKYLNNN